MRIIKIETYNLLQLKINLKAMDSLAIYMRLTPISYAYANFYREIPISPKPIASKIK